MLIYRQELGRSCAPGSPSWFLFLSFFLQALAGYPVSKIVRQTRCVTLFYADKMHLDVTPSLRVYGALERESFITHAKGPRHSVDDRFVDMNAYGFAQWYANMSVFL